ncbi:unnamed protein product [Laminaria digitata]
MLLVQRTLAFMSSGAVDASFSQGQSSSPSAAGAAAPSVFNFGHGFLLLGELGSPSADAVRTACWCLCAAGAALSVGFRPNAVAFAASMMQLYLLLLEKSLYTDEAYLFALVGLLLSFTDCGKTLGLEARSLDESHAHDGGRNAALRDQPLDTVPHWHVVLLRFQVCILHIHRGLAKAATADWLLGGQPLLHTLESMPPTHRMRRAVDWALSNDIPGLGGGSLQALAVRVNGFMVFLDLFLGVSLLAAPHYRPAGLAVQTCVHLAAAAFGRPDARAWHLLIVATGLLFVNPASLQEAIERVRAWLQPAVSYDTGVGSSARRNRGRGRVRRPSRGGGSSGDSAGGGGRAASRNPGASGGSGATGSALAAAVPTGAGERIGESGGGGGGGGGGGVRPKKKLPLQPRPSSPVAALISVYVFAQVLLPLRHVLGSFQVEWSREGHEFSWRAGGGVGGRGGGGGLVREEALVRMTHRPRGGGSARRGSAMGVQTVHLYGSPFTAQQVLRMVLDPDMLLQLAKKSAETSPAAGGGGGGRGGRGGKTKKPRTAPVSTVDAWKSINGRPFARWIDPTVDVYDERFGDEGPSNAEWLQLPPLEAELDRAAGVMETVRAKWALRGHGVTFFAARAGQTGLSNVFLGGYDPSNFNTTELCAVKSPPDPAAGHASNAGGKPVDASAESGGILLGVAMGEVELLTEEKSGVSEANSRVLTVRSGTVLAPTGQGHSVRAGSSPVSGRRGGGLAVWYYVHSCPEGLFHLCIGFLSGAGWEQLYPPHLGTRKGWTMEHGVPRRG